jgi:hypothetical protein
MPSHSEASDALFHLIAELVFPANGFAAWANSDPEYRYLRQQLHLVALTPRGVDLCRNRKHRPLMIW